MEATQDAIDLEAQVTEAFGSDNPAARLDIDTPTAVARVTCWESGDFDAEVIGLETEETLFSCHGVFERERTVAEQMVPFLAALGVIAK